MRSRSWFSRARRSSPSSGSNRSTPCSTFRPSGFRCRSPRSIKIPTCRSVVAGSEGRMGKSPTIGLVVPFAEDKVPAEGLIMYPDVTFVPRGVGVRALTPEGYDPAMAAIVPAAEHLAKRNVDAIMVIGTSLTFYKGAEVHRRLLEQLRAATGLPV